MAPKLMGDLFPRARPIFWLAILLLSLGGLYLTIVGSGIISAVLLGGYLRRMALPRR